MGVFRKLTFVVTVFAVLLGYFEYQLQQEISFGTPCQQLKVGQEDPAWEARIRAEYPNLLTTLEHFQEMRAAGHLDDPEAGTQRRVQHPVGWGCSNATLEVTNSAWMPKGKHSVEVRFSKNSFDPDKDPKFSSVALKIRGVAGARAAVPKEASAKSNADNRDTLDLIMASAPTLPIFVTPEDLGPLHEWAMAYGMLPGLLGYMTFKRPSLFPRLIPLLLNGAKITNPFYYPHFTIIPSRFNKDGAARFGVFPCDEAPMPSAEPDASGNFVAEKIEKTLKSSGGCLKLKAQVQSDACQDPLENFLVEWTGEWTDIGTLTFAKGAKFENDQRCEDLSFNPFHAPEALKPLGWVARVRRDLYADLSTKRLKANGRE